MKRFLYFTLLITSVSCSKKEAVYTEHLTNFSKESTSISLTETVFVSVKAPNVHPDLTELSIKYSPLFRIENIDFSKYPNLKKIEIFQSIIDSVNFTGLEINTENIEEISIWNSNLKSIKGLNRFSNLKRLNLSQNSLNQVPEDVTQLSKLELLNLNGNPLDSVPYDFPKHINLQLPIHLVKQSKESIE